MTTTDINLHVEEYCVLCQHGVTLSQDNRNSNGKNNDDRFDSNKWEANVIAFFAGGSYDDESNGNTRLHIFSQPDLSAYWPGVDGGPRLVLRSTTTRDAWIRVGFGAQQEDDDNGYPQKDSILYFVHICCWKAANDKNPVLYRDLYRLAEATRFILPRSYCGDAPAVQLRIEIPQEQESKDTHMTQLLSHVLSLPVELHRVILDHLDDGMTRSLLRARQTATLLEKLSSSSASAFGGIQIQTLSLHPNSHLAAKTTRLFGYTYLENVRVVETLDKSDWNASVPIRDAVVTAAKVYIGPLGVLGLMLVYADGSLSPVLGTTGSAFNNFFQPIPFYANTDSAPPTLHIRHDGLKVIYISRTTVDGKRGEQTFWNVLPPTDSELSIIDSTPRPPTTNRQRYPYSGQRFFQYLPLRLDDGTPATGLTVHCTAQGIVRMTSHFGGDGLLTSEKQRHIGHASSSFPESVPAHISIRPDETIQLVALRIPDRQECPELADCGPSLITTTNKAQRVLCGPYAPTIDDKTHSRLLFTAKRDTPLVGLFVDIATVTATGGVLQSFGACIENSVSDVSAPSTSPNATRPNYISVSIPRAPYSNELMGHPQGQQQKQLNVEEAVVFSLGLVASKNVQSIHLRRSTKTGKSRVLGFCIRYANNRFQTLGAWMPDTGTTSATKIDTIYDASKDNTETAGTLPCLSFMFSDDGTHLTDIVIGEVAATNEHDLVVPVARHGFRNLSWWCTATHDAIHTTGPLHAYIHFVELAEEGIREDLNPQWARKWVHVQFGSF